MDFPIGSHISSHMQLPFLLPAHLPAPQTVKRPRTQSTPGVSGSGKGRQRSWLGVTMQQPKSAVSDSTAGRASVQCVGGSGSHWCDTRQWLNESYTRPSGSMGRKGSWVTEGKMRYSQVRRLEARGAVKGVPDSCSV